MFTLPQYQGESFIQSNLLGKPGDQGSVEQICPTQIFCWFILPPSARMWNYSLTLLIDCHSFSLSVSQNDLCNNNNNNQKGSKDLS